MTKKKTITFTVEQCEYEEILTYARIKGHGGQFPASNFAHYAVFQMMKKYPVNEAETAKYRKRYQEGEKPTQVAQPNALEGNQ